MVVSFLQHGIAKSSKSSNFAKLTVNFEEFADLSQRDVFRYTRSIVGRQQIFFRSGDRADDEPCVPTFVRKPI